MRWIFPFLALAGIPQDAPYRTSYRVINVHSHFAKYQDRILFGTDGSVRTAGRESGARNILVYPCDDPDGARTDPKDEAAVGRWKERQVVSHGRHFEE